MVKTNYIAKIMDYGRSYFGNLGNNQLPSSGTIGRTIFNSKVCSKLAPENVGYNFFEYGLMERNYYISSLMRNKSHDLRLVYIVSTMTKKSMNCSMVVSIMKDNLVLQKKNRMEVKI